jgi:acyl carrier protein
MQQKLEWVTKVLTVEGRILTLNDSRHTVSEWDSMGDLMLLSGIEEELKVFLSSDELSGIATVKDLLQLLERKNAFPAG